MNTLHDQAAAAGIAASWRDVGGQEHRVADATLQNVLAALHAGVAEAADEPLLTADAGLPFACRSAAKTFRLTLESGAVIEGHTSGIQPGRVALPEIMAAGYHRLELGDAVKTVAVAPRRAFTLADAARGEKLWGLAVQLYALRRPYDGGIGDFGALADFAAKAAGLGADAVAISPVHAQFAADVTRYMPYAPSNRAALNALYIPLDLPDDGGDCINWPEAAAARLAALRAWFAREPEEDAVVAFLRQAGQGLAQHALFEALSGHFGQADYRSWPEAYQNPHFAAVRQFRVEHGAAIKFHVWLQYQADKALGAAQRAARAAGARIGLISDLAVGTDPAGSHSWSRQAEMLQGLQIGAPPDLVNREGQGWGITAFSPEGLRRSGFAGFIDMLRHAMRHAGGVRIDHVMGLARLWVIPNGASPTEGAYLSLPEADLLRLVRLESQRHRAVVLGEDLGTLPIGYHAVLEDAGISGLRVMWFERQGSHFTPPQNWTADAVAMTTTHDLPSVAGWWEGTDIAWRDRLHMAGDDVATRAADRQALWGAFCASGAASGPMPAEADGVAAADAACAHLAHAACTLALLPMEDALASTEQPNLPGTTTEHPNWRRRLPGDVLGRADVVARLGALNEGRKT